MNPSETYHTPWTVRDALWVFLVIICIALAVNIAIVLGDLPKYFDASPHKSLITLGLFLLQEIVFILPLYYGVIKRYGLKFSALGFIPVSFKETAKLIFKGFGMVFISNIVLVSIISQVERQSLPGFGQQQSPLELFGESRLDIIFAVIALVIIAPVVEEILFRGFLLQTLLSNFKPWIASLVTALIFAGIHLQFQSFGIILILGFILNWIFMRSRSIIPSIAFHMLNNALAFIAQWLLVTGRLG